MLVNYYCWSRNSNLDKIKQKSYRIKNKSKLKSKKVKNKFASQIM